MTLYIVAYLVLGFIVSAFAYRFDFLEDDELYIIYILGWILFYPIIITVWGIFSVLVYLWLFIAEGGRMC